MFNKIFAFFKNAGSEKKEASSSERIAHLHTLKWEVLALLIFVSLIPLGFISAGAYIVFGEIISNKSTEHLQTIVRDHAATVDLFLEERLMALDLVARSYEMNQITRQEELKTIFKNLNNSYSQSFLDIGAIDQNGDHLAYLGPYDLRGKNYAGAEWFKHVSKEGAYISDVFLGVRRVPHFIMAVRKDDEFGNYLILRSTINSEVFSNLVSKGRIGKTGDCFLLDRQGRYQTPPLSGGKLLDQSGIPTSDHKEIRTVPARTPEGREVIRTTKWIKNGQWMLVAQQEKSEVEAAFRNAMAKGMTVFAAGVLVIVLTSFFTTRYLFALIERTTEQKEILTSQLLQASKLASLGEMATGLAHEINNPLAIIATEQTNISDLLKTPKLNTPEIDEMFGSVAMTKKQVMRCKEITQKMLQFGRQRSAAGTVLNPGPQLAEIIKLMKQQAKINNVDICFEQEKNLPNIYIDSTELQQLVVNITNNAVGAIESGGAIVVSAWSEDKRFHITIEDTGPGIPKELREKIFEPFFTTKSVGKGTGLGLSVCYGIATKWRGKIKLESKTGSGARFDVEFPVSDEKAG